ncbi:MAG TPA: prenyltransferase/squalene oxidase repeat-containing protein [Aggregatilineales bacterium]|nr:prenyltransferase/squalene oxidase repeat-containing protein [Aggregatilineales bacterium]
MKRTVRALLTLVVMLTLAIGFSQTTHAQTVGQADIKAAVKWLSTLQNNDGGFGDGTKPESNVGATADAVYAIAVAGEDVTTFKKGDKTPIDYLQDQVKAGKVTAVGDIGRLLRAVSLAVGEGQRAFGGTDLVQMTIDALNKAKDGGDIYGEALAVIALSEVDEVPRAAIASLLKAQNPDGGWGSAGGQPSDTNSTAQVIEALISSGRYRLIGSALAYLKSQQNADGGWPLQKSSKGAVDSDSISTAIVIEALGMSGEDLVDWNSPDIVLAKFQQKDGSFTAGLAKPAASFAATIAAIPALSTEALIDVQAPPAQATAAH